MINKQKLIDLLLEIANAKHEPVEHRLRALEILVKLGWG